MRMNILVVGDIHNDIENIMSYLDSISRLDFDVIVCPGDFSDVGLRGFTPLDIAKIVVSELKSFKRPVVAVPGNFDKDIIPFLEEEAISVHGRGKVIGNVGFYGYGGARTPFGTTLEPSEEELLLGLDKGYEEAKDGKWKVQVTHMPPARTKMDLIYTGAHVGSEAIRKFIEERKPVAAICSHIHEGRGVDEIGSTKIVNAGRFPEGYCGIITINDKEVTAKVVNLL